MWLKTKKIVGARGGNVDGDEHQPHPPLHPDHGRASRRVFRHLAWFPPEAGAGWTSCGKTASKTLPLPLPFLLPSVLGNSSVVANPSAAHNHNPINDNNSVATAVAVPHRPWLGSVWMHHTCYVIFILPATSWDKSSFLSIKGVRLRKVKQFMQDHTVSCRARIQIQGSGHTPLPAPPPPTALQTWACTYFVLVLCWFLFPSCYSLCSWLTNPLAKGSLMLNSRPAICPASESTVFPLSWACVSWDSV